MTPPAKVWFCDFWHAEKTHDIRQNPLFRLLDRNIPVELDRDPDVLFFSCFGKRHLDYDCTRVFYSGENARTDPAVAHFSFSGDYGDGERRFRLPLYRLYAEYEGVRDHPRRMPANWNDRGFCSFVVSQPRAPERIAFFEALNRRRTVASGGKVLNNVGGPVADKMGFISGYRFHIAFENASYPGYTTEKLQHALAGGCIPVYWGNPRIAEDFNAAAFVNCHDFASWEAVVDRAMEIDASPGLQRAMLEAPAFPGGVETDCCREDNLARALRKVFDSARTQPSRTKRRGRSWLRLLSALRAR